MSAKNDADQGDGVFTVGVSTVDDVLMGDGGPGESLSEQDISFVGLTVSSGCFCRNTQPDRNIQLPVS